MSTRSGQDSWLLRLDVHIADIRRPILGKSKRLSANRWNRCRAYEAEQGAAQSHRPHLVGRRGSDFLKGSRRSLSDRVGQLRRLVCRPYAMYCPYSWVMGIRSRSFGERYAIWAPPPFPSQPKRNDSEMIFSKHPFDICVSKATKAE